MICRFSCYGITNDNHKCDELIYIYLNSWLIKSGVFCGIVSILWFVISSCKLHRHRPYNVGNDTAATEWHKTKLEIVMGIELSHFFATLFM